MILKDEYSRVISSPDFIEKQLTFEVNILRLQWNVYKKMNELCNNPQIIDSNSYT